MSMRRCSLADSTVQVLILFGLFSCYLSAPTPLIDVCPIVNNLTLCGQGTCEPNSSATIPFDCKCDPGWKYVQILDFTFPTCALPNCSLDYQCGNGSPLQPVISPNPLCALCLGAKCTVNGFLNATCHCEEGYGNLLNNPNLPCFQKCYVGGKCNNGLATPSPKSSGGSMINYSMKTLEFLLTVILSVTIFVTWF